MKKILILTLLLSLQKVVAQTIINITATGNSADNSITIEEEANPSLDPNKKYQIVINGVNSAHTTLKVKAKSKEIYTPIPEGLKTILPGMTGSTVGVGVAAADVSDLFLSITARTHRLNTIKEKADSLHKSSLFATNKSLADRYYGIIINQYQNTQERDLPDSVISDIQFLTAVKDIADQLMVKEPSLETNVVEIYSEILIITSQLEKNNYQASLDYISRSRTAEDFVNSKTFSGSKDLVELNIILIDTYTKDTLANEIKTLYTKGGTLGLSFSSGFFYTSGLSDQPYYLKVRPDENVAVLPDRQIKSDVSIGALVHLYYKCSAFTRISPSLGLAVSPFDSKSRYLIGMSVLLGKEKTIGLSAGRTWAKMKELSASVSADANGLYLPKGTTVIPTFDKIMSSWFFGISYNLVSSRK